MSQYILLFGILGITSVEFKVWSGINVFTAGIVSAVMARIFHFCYSILQEKQETLPLDFSSHLKFIMSVEKEVIRRLNVHRNMRRVLGFIIMFLYYAANIYYCIKYNIVFSQEQGYSWFIAFLIGAGFEFVIIEPFRVYIQVVSVNFLKVGGSHMKEAFAKFFVSEEFLASLDN